MRKITSSQRDLSTILPTLAQRIFAVWEITGCVLSPNFIQIIISVSPHYSKISSKSEKELLSSLVLLFKQQ